MARNIKSKKSRIKLKVTKEQRLMLMLTLETFYGTPSFEELYKQLKKVPLNKLVKIVNRKGEEDWEITRTLSCS